MVNFLLGVVMVSIINVIASIIYTVAYTSVESKYDFFVALSVRVALSVFWPITVFFWVLADIIRFWQKRYIEN